MTYYSSYCRIPSGAAKLCQDMATLVNNPQGSDIQFKVGGGNFIHQENGETIYNESETVTLYAHSVILRCRSRYFATMLDVDKHWKESSSGIIYKPNISPSVFQDILDYIYTGDIRAKNSETIIELIIAADEMDLEELKTGCLDYLTSIVEDLSFDENDGDDEDEDREGSTRQQIPIDVALRKYIVPILNLTDSLSLSHLPQKLIAAILSRMSVIIKSPDAYTAFINGISSDALHKIVLSDYLSVKERDVWDLVFSWGCHQVGISKVAVEALLNNPKDEENRDESSNGTVVSTAQLDQIQKNLSPLLPAIRFSLLDRDDYHQILGVLSYFLSRHQFLELNRFFIKHDSTEPFDKPRYGTRVASNITVEYMAWELLRKNIFETGDINCCSSLRHLKFKLLFRASDHDFRAKDFHKHCDNKGPTLVLVKSASGYIFGGVNFCHWKSDNSRPFSASNFLFLLPDGNHRTKSAIFKIMPNAHCSSYNYKCCGPIFGRGNGESDLTIQDSANINCRSYSHLPGCYDGKEASHTSLAGSKNFEVSEYEVFAIYV